MRWEALSVKQSTGEAGERGEVEHRTAGAASTACEAAEARFFVFFNYYFFPHRLHEGATSDASLGTAGKVRQGFCGVAFEARLPACRAGPSSWTARACFEAPAHPTTHPHLQVVASGGVSDWCIVFVVWV